MVYAIGKSIFWLYLHLFYKLNVSGLENIPKNGSVIICANHINSLDPISIAVSVKRQVHFMAKKEIYKNPLFSWVLNALGVFPVDRSITDMKAYKKTISILKDNKVVGIFVQGTRVANAESVAAKDGVSLFALKSKAVVVPVGLNSSYKKFNRINIKIGKPINLNHFYDMHINKEVCGQVTDIIALQINELVTYKNS